MKTNLMTLVIILSFGIDACSTKYVLTKVPQQTPYFQTQYLSYEELMAKCHGQTCDSGASARTPARSTMTSVRSSSSEEFPPLPDQ